MSTLMSTKMSTAINNKRNAWNVAILDAERKIQEAISGIVRLKQAVKSFKELRDNDEPFPGESSEQNEAQT